MVRVVCDEAEKPTGLLLTPVGQECLDYMTPHLIRMETAEFLSKFTAKAAEQLVVIQKQIKRGKDAS